jgi:hypothetical protein
MSAEAAMDPGSPHQQASPRAPAASRAGFALLWLQQHLWLVEAGTWKVGPRTPAAHRLGSPMPAAAAMLPGSPHPNRSRPQALCCIESTRWFKPTGQPAWSASFADPRGTLNFLLSASSLLSHTSEPHAHVLLFCWCQEVSFPTEHRAQC